MASEYAGPRSLRRLLDAVLTVGSELDLPSVLQRIVQTAVDLVDARYGALGVLNEAGTGLTEFITVGIDDDAHRAIGSLPKGLGLLGTVITDARPLRLPDLGEHPDRSGFPLHHPPMTSFLGVPVRVRNDVFGNLYLTDKLNGEVFTDVDEELALGLASAAGVAIENARLFDQVRSREAALAATHEVASALVAGTDSLEVLRLVAHHARELVHGDLATIALPETGTDMLVVEVSDSVSTLALEGQRFPRQGSVSGDVLASGRIEVLIDASVDGRVAQPQVQSRQIGPIVFVPLIADGSPFGTLSVARSSGQAPFTASEVEVIGSFAAHASVVLDHDRTRQRLQQLHMLEDQERIARDLHDGVIQRVYSVGLALQAVSRLIDNAQARERLASAIDDLDDVVKQIRTVIFDVEPVRREQAEGIRSKLLEVTREAARASGHEPRVAFTGPVDAAIGDALAADIVGTLRECLSNVNRHAQAEHVDVELMVTDTDVMLRVTDDGIGMTAERGSSGGHGLRNMRGRAERLGGTFHIGPRDEGGTIMEWQAPLSA